MQYHKNFSISRDSEQSDSLKSSAIFVEQKQVQQTNQSNNHNNSIAEQSERDPSDQSSRVVNQYDYAHQEEESSLPLCMQYYNDNNKPQDQSDNDQKQTDSFSQISQYLKKTSYKERKETKTIQQSKKSQNLKIESSSGIKAGQEFQLPDTVYQERNNILSLQLERQRLQKLHFQNLLSLIIEESRQSRQEFNKISIQYHQKLSELDSLKQENNDCKIKISDLYVQNQHLKQLIYLANQNYQEVHKKLKEKQEIIKKNHLQKQERQKTYAQRMDKIKEGVRQIMLTQFNNQRQLFSNSNRQTHKADKTTPQLLNSQQNQRIFNSQQNQRVNDNCFSFGDNQRRDFLLLQSKKYNKNNCHLQNFNSNTKNDILKQKNLQSQSSSNFNKKGNKQPGSNRNEKQKQNQLMDQKSKKNIKDLSLNIVSNFGSPTNKLANWNTKTSNGGLGNNSIKSPSHSSVEENYRKIFLKTLSVNHSVDRV